MPVFLDSGILLRAMHRSDPHYATIRQLIRSLLRQKTSVFTGLQQLAEFWNVCTRPASSRGGLGLSISETSHRLRRLERGFQILVETPTTPDIWKELVARYSVKGVQVHDARMIALKRSHLLADLITLNKADFLRFVAEGIRPVTPTEFLTLAQ